MAFKAFTISHIFERPFDLKDKFSIQCMESFHSNIYMGTKHGTIHHLILPSSVNTRKLSGSPVIRIRLVPIFNHLLSLCNRSITVLNMFSLEANTSFKKINNVSQFELWHGKDQVRMVVCPREKKQIRLLVLSEDRWDVLKEIALVQEPVEIAVDGDSMCVGTADKYLLCNATTMQIQELFHHGHGKQVLVTAMGAEEFLINGPGGLGLCVLASGECQRPPLPWPQDVLAACVCFPYVLSLQAHSLEVYSLLDQQCKQTVSVSGAVGLISTAGGSLVFTERSVLSLSAVSEEQQIQALVLEDRLEEALQLLEGGNGQRNPDEDKELQRSLTRKAGFQHFFQERFTEAKDLFEKSNLNPLELLQLYPDIHLDLPKDLQPQMEHSKARELQEQWQTDPSCELRYLGFLQDFLLAFRSSTGPGPDVDSALLWLFVHMADNDSLLLLLSHPNACKLNLCEDILRKNSRFFALGQLYQSHGKYQDALQTWVDLLDRVLTDVHSCSDVLERVVSMLSRLEERGTVRTHTAWALNKDQELGVQIFTKRSAVDEFPPEEVLALLETFSRARTKYLEFLIYEKNSKETGHHTLLVSAYVSISLQNQENEDNRRKLQQLLWDSHCYDASAVLEQLHGSHLHPEKAIVLGRHGDHLEALTLLLGDSADTTLAEDYCLRLTSDPQSTHSLLLTLLNILLTEGRSTDALLLLHNHPQAFSGEEVLDLLPECWSVQLISKYLEMAIRKAFHQSRMKKVQKSLEQTQLLRHKALWMHFSGGMLRLDGSQSCDICGEALTSPSFVHTAHGGLLHLDCAKHSAMASPKYKGTYNVTM